MKFTLMEGGKQREVGKEGQNKETNGGIKKRQDVLWPDCQVGCASLSELCSWSRLASAEQVKSQCSSLARGISEA